MTEDGKANCHSSDNEGKESDIMRIRSQKIRTDIRRWKEATDEDKIRTLSMSFKTLFPRLYPGNLPFSIPK